MPIDTACVARLLGGGESLTVEFKSEKRRQISDNEIYEAVVCLANSDGGALLLGVENDGTVTGARSRHGTTTEPRRLQVAIFNNTVPSILTRIAVHTLYAREVLSIEVDAYPEICMTKDGKCVRRVEGFDGPECVPFYPHEHASRRGDLGLYDFSAHLADWARWDDFDPLEIERLRQLIERRRGDRALLALDDRALVQALQLVETRAGALVPNMAGLLLLGREASLRRAVPTHEVAFQVLDASQNVLVNDWFAGPLLETIEAIEARFDARNQEQEVMVGFIRLPVPDYAPDAFREAVNNALMHRDYMRRGTVVVQFQHDHLFLSNPGGFVEGINVDNLLTHEPKPRNPRLAQAFRRIGLVETTGRGIDQIYEGQLVYGRPLPDYAASNREGVRLRLRGRAASLEFARFVYEQSRDGIALSLDELIALNQLQHERRVGAATVGRLIQRDVAEARAVLERLVERGLIEAIGDRRERAYQLSAALYDKLGARAGYVRIRAFDAIRQEAMVLEFVWAYERIKRSDVAELCGITPRQASLLLDRLVRSGKLVRRGVRRGAYYERAI